MRIVLLLHVLLLLPEVRGDGGEVPTTPSEFGVITNPLSSEASFEDIPSEGPYVIQALPDPAPDSLPDSGPEETVAGESETGDESTDVETGGESTDVETGGESTDVETGVESTDVETDGAESTDIESDGERTDVKPDGETADDESAEGDLEDSSTEDETLPDIPEGDVSEPEVDDAPAEEEEIEEEEKKEEIPDQDKEAPASSKLGKEDEDGFIEEDVEVEKIDDANRPRPMVNTEDKTTGPFEEGTDNVAKVPIVVEEEAVNVAELVLTNTGGLIICHVEADPLIYTSCNMSVWVNGLENSTTINVYQTSTLILETDSVKCKASCSSATGPVTMTAKHAPSNIFTLPIMILIGIGGLVVITTILILIHFIKKSRRKEKGYHFPLNDNTVEAYNLEEEAKPAASLNGTQVVVSDSYNLVDG